MKRGKYIRTIDTRIKNGKSMSGKKHSIETRKKIGLIHKGSKHSIESIKKSADARRGLKRSDITKQKMSFTRKGRKLTKDWKKKISLSLMGKMSGYKNPMWNGGISKLTVRIRSSFKNRQWISDVFSRDDFTCQECGIRGSILNAHHIKRFSIILKENNIKTFEEALNCEELWNINNGLTLCKECHKKTDSCAGRRTMLK